MKPTEQADRESVEDSKRFRKLASSAVPPEPAAILEWGLSIFPSGDSFSEDFVATCMEQSGTTAEEVKSLIAELGEALDKDEPRVRGLVLAKQLLAQLELVADCAEKWLIENPRLASGRAKLSR